MIPGITIVLVTAHRENEIILYIVIELSEQGHTYHMIGVQIKPPLIVLRMK